MIYNKYTNRKTHSTKPSSPTMSINVINRHGEQVPLKLETISARLQQLADAHPRLSVSTDTIAIKTVSALVDGIKTSQIDAISANICASLIIEDPEYDDLAARIIISDLHKNTTANLVHYANDLIGYEYRGVMLKILHPKVVAFVKVHNQELDRAIDYSKDYHNNYFGAMTLIRSYLLSYKYDNDTKVVKERPQQMLLRVAIGINMNHINDDGSADADILSSIIETYKLLADGYYTHATPTLFNAGTINHTLSSCYLLAIDDSLDNIYSRLTDISKISKFSGGVGVHMSQLRASGSVIASTIGRSEGLVPLMRVYNESTRYVSQGGGKRKGSTAVYIEPWHADIESAILSQKQQGAPELLCRDLFLALWVPDIFMTRLRDALKTKKEVMWSLMCPHECPGLTDTYGGEFEELYISYEKQGRFRKQISIKVLWDLIMATQIETGKPYLMYKDHVNYKCNQNNLGVIKSSNLCVAGDTPILTDAGYVPIKELTGTKARVWNGKEWSLSPVLQTGNDQKLLRVTMNDGSFLDCTEYHKFQIKNADGSYEEQIASELKPGDISKQVEQFPIVLGPETSGPYMPEDSGPNVVPLGGRIYTRMSWLADRLDSLSGYMQITSHDIDRLRKIKLMSNTLGTSPFIVESPRGYHLRFSSVDVQFLLDEMMMPIAKFPEDYKPVSQPTLEVMSVESLDGLQDTFCFNEPILHMGVFNGVYASNCSEITIYSDTDNIGVCNLASLCLPRFMKSNGSRMEFDYEHFNSVVQSVVMNMNKVIDNNKYPLEQARRSDADNRPIGIGVQGLAEVFMIMRTSFDSEIATEVNKKIFETMYYAALVASNKRAQVLGSYKNFSTSLAAQGILQFDLWDSEPSNMWDWKTLKRDIKSSGLRNSLLLALMPTAGTSIISGHTESVEIPQSNIYTRSTLSGRFQVVNKHLVRALKAAKLWTPAIRNKIIENDGSVQSITEISPTIRNVFKTVYEYKLTSIIKACADREKFICQSSSNNRYLSKPDISVLTNMHLYSWKFGLKTSCYYTRIKAQSLGSKLGGSSVVKVEEDEDEVCLSCSA